MTFKLCKKVTLWCECFDWPPLVATIGFVSPFYFNSFLNFFLIKLHFKQFPHIFSVVIFVFFPPGFGSRFTALTICGPLLKMSRGYLLAFPNPKSRSVLSVNRLCSVHSWPWLNTTPGIGPESVEMFIPAFTLLCQLSLFFVECENTKIYIRILYSSIHTSTF